MLVTVAQSPVRRRASPAPRCWSGATDIAGTIGGGHLEFQAIATARAFGCGRWRRAALGRFKLGPELAQCCGGRCALLFETLSGQAASWLQDLVGDGIQRVRAVRGHNRRQQRSRARRHSSDRGFRLGGRCPRRSPNGQRAWRRMLDRCALVELREGSGCYVIETVRPSLRSSVPVRRRSCRQGSRARPAPLPFRITWIDGRERCLSRRSAAAGHWPSIPPTAGEGRKRAGGSTLSRHDPQPSAGSGDLRAGAAARRLRLSRADRQRNQAGALRRPPARHRHSAADAGAARPVRSAYPALPARSRRRLRRPWPPSC